MTDCGGNRENDRHTKCESRLALFDDHEEGREGENRGLRVKSQNCFRDQNLNSRMKPLRTRAGVSSFQAG